MRLEVGRQRIAGFPCVRVQSDGDFVSLLPVTKLQVEEWIWGSFPASVQTTDLIQRLELSSLEKGRFPDGVGLMKRIALKHIQADTQLSAVAANLSVWNSAEELGDTSTRFPTETSEWGRFIKWQGGRIPSYREWRRTLDRTRNLATAEILRGVLELGFDWEPVVESLLRRLADTMPRDSFGLPFMSLGLYELIADSEIFDRHSLVERRREVRARVTGSSPAWPSLADRDLWKNLLAPVSPAVAVRLWFPVSALRTPVVSFDVEARSRPDAAQPDHPSQSEPDRPPTLLRRLWPKREPERRLPPYVAGGAKMRGRCPNCFEPVADAVFQQRASFYCYEQITAEGRERGEAVRGHSITRPESSTDRIIINSQEVLRLYLEIAQTRPQNVRVVALGGFPEAGKTTWLLSFGGLCIFPDGNSFLFRAFPRSWDFGLIRCSVSNKTSELQVRRNPLGAVERMWLDGELPIRTVAEQQGFCDPIRFNRGNGQKELMALIDDTAGELLFSDRFHAGKSFPHVSSTTDAIFFLPCDRIQNLPLEQFLLRMTNAVQIGEASAVNLKDINLVLVFSKIDQLKHSKREDERALLGRILQPDYRFPSDRDEQGLKRYLNQMKEVHFQIEDWIRRYRPQMEGVLHNFGSVRLCGLSAFGFQPEMDRSGPGNEYEGRLHFGPQPVRAPDPILWLLEGNGLLGF